MGAFFNEQDTLHNSIGLIAIAFAHTEGAGDAAGQRPHHRGRPHPLRNRGVAEYPQTAGDYYGQPRTLQPDGCSGGLGDAARLVHGFRERGTAPTGGQGGDASGGCGA